jgi:hypothetical protein
LALNSIKLRTLTKIFFSKFHFCMSTIDPDIKMKVRFLYQSEGPMGHNHHGFLTVRLMV